MRRLRLRACRGPLAALGLGLVTTWSSVGLAEGPQGGQGGTGAQQGGGALATRQPIDVEDLNDNLQRYSGKQVQVVGEAREPIGTAAFVLESGGLFDDEIAVIVPKNLKGFSMPPEDDQKLMVTGTLRSLQIVDIEREYDLDLTPELEVELGPRRFYLVASAIERRPD